MGRILKAGTTVHVYCETTAAQATAAFEPSARVRALWLWRLQVATTVAMPLHHLRSY